MISVQLESMTSRLVPTRRAVTFAQLQTGAARDYDYFVRPYCAMLELVEYLKWTPAWLWMVTFRHQPSYFIRLELSKNENNKIGQTYEKWWNCFSLDRWDEILEIQLYIDPEKYRVGTVTKQIDLKKACNLLIVRRPLIQEFKCWCHEIDRAYFMGWWNLRLTTNLFCL